MNDEGTILTGEAQRQAVMAKICRDLIQIIIWGGIGWAVLIYAMAAGGIVVTLAGMPLGLLIGTTPIRKGGLGAMSFWRDYEVITTYSDGSVKSDYGAQSNAAGIVFGVLMLIIGGFIMLIKIPYLCIKYVINYFAAKTKPSLFQSAFPIMALGLVVFILASVFPFKLGWYHRGADDRARIAEREALNAAADKFPVNHPADNGLPFIISEIRYRSDATVVIITETKAGAATPLRGSGHPESRYNYYGHKVSTAFRITAPSGTYDSTDFLSVYDSAIKQYTGVEILFPAEFTDSSFTMTETSIIGDRDGGNRPPKDPVVFTNVTVQK